MPEFKTNHSTLHYQITGAGSPLILLHGFLEDYSIFNNLIPSLHANHFQTICIDLPGHGKSVLKSETCTMDFMAEEVIDLLLQLHISDACIVGHSMGGYVALAMCKINPRFKIILLHSNFWADSELKKQDRNRVIEVVSKNKNLFIQEAIPNLFAPGNKIIFHQEILNLIEKAKLLSVSNIIAATAGMRDRNDQRNLVKTHVIAIIQGHDDPIVSNEILQSELATIEPKPPIFYIQHCGHMGFIENPSEIINCLTKVLIQ